MPFLLDSWETEDDLSDQTSKNSDAGGSLVVSIDFNHVLSQNVLFVLSFDNEFVVDLFLELSHFIRFALSLSGSSSLVLILQFLFSVFFLLHFNLVLPLFLRFDSTLMNLIELGQMVLHKSIRENVEGIDLVHEILHFRHQPGKHVLLKYVHLEAICEVTYVW